MPPTDPQVESTTSLFRNWYISPAGGPTGAGLIRASHGVPERPRTLECHALVYLVHGSGTYTDPYGERDMRAGDLIIVDPNIPHWYGPVNGSRWDELFVVFEGPVFDAWKDAGLLYRRDRRPRLDPVRYWYPRLVAGLGTGNRGDTDQALRELTGLQNLLRELLAQEEAEPKTRQWLAHARDLMDTGLNDRETADALGVSYDTFRRRFARLSGMPPSRYRVSRTMETACRLLVAEDRTIKSIARELGFYDEFHFSRRFRDVIEQTPSEFRRSFGGPSPEGTTTRP
ncbi:helix-turn-helix domain-containing protein [Janibacter cremeus]|uniref:AraC-like DNA-binding protein n=1 Tax=Janibacter cremeus TaxID=1285192 RepID=A0A852VK47_9MICO|nr:AraC family transcriptional regulator [Janibacter cremeus]NYF97442.1 AraC-like DNA-binding protein [Janibacter cremeus]